MAAPVEDFSVSFDRARVAGFSDIVGSYVDLTNYIVCNVASRAGL